MPHNGRRLEVGVLERSRERIGSAKETAEHVDASEMGVSDNGQESGNLRDMVHVNESLGMSHELAVLEETPTASAQQQRGVIHPQRRHLLEASLVLLEHLRDECSEPTGEQPPAACSKALLEPIRTRRAARVPPDLDRRKGTSAEPRRTSAPDGVQGDDLIFNRANPAPVAGGDSSLGALAGRRRREGREGQRPAR